MTDISYSRPVTLHLSLPPFTAYKILEEHYGLRLADLTRFSAGSSNLTYRAVTFTNVVTVTLLFGDSKKNAGRLADMTNTLAEQGVPTPRVLPSLTGEYVTSVDGIPLLVREYAQGRHPNPSNTQECFRVGQAIADAHLRAAYDGEPTRRFPANWEEQLLNCDDIDFLSWVADAAGLLDEVPDGLPKGFVHSDLFPDNVIVDGETVTLIDWELGGNDWLAMDLALALIGFMFNGMTNPEPLLAGYNSVRPLSVDERAALPVFATYGAAHLTFRRYLAAYAQTPTRQSKNWYRELLDWWLTADATAFIS